MVDILAMIERAVKDIGVLVLIGLVWKARGIISTFMSSHQAMDDRVKQTAIDVAATKLSVDTIQNNHLAHMSKDMAEVNAEMKEQTKTLASIDKGIAVLVDRA